MGIRRRRRRDPPRCAQGPGLARTHPGLVFAARPTRRCRAPGCRRPTPTACRTCTAWSGNGPRISPRCWCRADNRDQGDADNAKFCGAGALSMDDRDNYAVLMRVAMLSSLEARRHHRQPRLPLRQERTMKCHCSDMPPSPPCCWSPSAPSPRAATQRRRRCRRDSVYQLPLPLTDQHGDTLRLAQRSRQAAAGGDVLHLVPVHLPADRRQRQGGRARS